MVTVKERVTDFIFPDAEPSLAQTKLIDAAISVSEQALLSYLPVATKTVPEKLSWVLVELAIKRYNRVGSEGMKSESIEGHSVNFNDKADIEEFKGYIDHYLDSLEDALGTSRGKVRFL